MIDRAALAARLTLSFGPLLAYCALGDPPPRAFYDQVIGDSLAAMGYTVPPDPDGLVGTQDADLPYLLDYFALRIIARRLAAQVFHHTPEATYRWEELSDHANKLLADALAAVEARGYAVEHGMQLGRIQLDFLEPGPAGATAPWLYPY